MLEEKRMLSDAEAASYIGMSKTATRSFCDGIGAAVKIGTRRLNDRNIIDKALDKLHKQNAEIDCD